MVEIDFEKYHKAAEHADLVKVIGKVIQAVGLIIEAQVQGVSIGDLCSLRLGKGDIESYAEVVGFREGKVLLMPLGTTSGISPGSQVLAAGHPLKVKVGQNFSEGSLADWGSRSMTRGPSNMNQKHSSTPNRRIP